MPAGQCFVTFQGLDTAKRGINPRAEVMKSAARSARQCPGVLVAGCNNADAIPQGAFKTRMAETGFADETPTDQSMAWARHVHPRRRPA
jgi:hypothetical protein